MAKDYAISFYKSKSWRKARESYYKSKFGLCERCGEPGDIVHHKEYITPENINDPNITLDFDNLELLCQDCHNKEHIGTTVTQKGLMFDDNGNLIKMDAPHV
jgi:5-methylcytosine-specific restriction endonuclease McrA